MTIKPISEQLRTYHAIKQADGQKQETKMANIQISDSIHSDYYDENIEVQMEIYNERKTVQIRPEHGGSPISIDWDTWQKIIAMSHKFDKLTKEGF